MKLIDRAKNILLTPKTEWETIAGESTSTADLYKGYVVPLAAIGPVASFLGMTLVGVSIPFMGAMRISFASALTAAVLTYVFALVGVYVLSLIIDALAPTFNGQKNPQQALKAAAYAYTPAWVTGVLYLLPALGILVALASLYGLYLLYLGLPVLMKSAREKTVAYTVVVMICALVLGVVFAAVTSALGVGAGADFGQMPMGGPAHMR